MFDISMQGITIGPIEIRFYSLMILSGLLAGVLLGQREAKRLGEDPDHVINIAVLGAVFGLIGARLYHVFDANYWPYYRANPGQIIAIWNGGIGIFGAIAGAALALVAYVWWVNRQASQRRGGAAKRMDPLRWFDIGAPAFLLGQAIGRWGNFFNQELFGPPTDLPWGIPIPLANRPLEWREFEYFHPLFLYESLLSFLGVFVLLYVARRFSHRVRPGDILLLYLVWYPAERFVLEFLRAENWRLGAIPMAQIVSALLIAAAVAALIWRHRRPAPSSSDDRPEAPTRSHSAVRRQRRRTGSGTHG